MGRDADAIDDLLRELAELRELDRFRQGHAPGSAAHDAATLEVDLRSRRLMDRFRDLKERRERRPDVTVDRVTADQFEGTQPTNAQRFVDRHAGSRLN